MSHTSKVGELVGEIAFASNEQAQGIEQINAAVSEMDQVTQQNAATAEESASSHAVIENHRKDREDLQQVQRPDIIRPQEVLPLNDEDFTDF